MVTKFSALMWPYQWGMCCILKSCKIHQDKETFISLPCGCIGTRKLDRIRPFVSDRPIKFGGSDGPDLDHVQFAFGSLMVQLCQDKLV